MNPLAIETAIAAALNASALPSTTINLGTSYAELTPESLNLIVAVKDLTQSVWGLWKANVNIKIECPALLGSSSYTTFKNTLDSVLSSLNNSYFTTNWPTAAGSPNYAGISSDIKSTESQDHHQWMADVDFVIGISV